MNIFKFLFTLLLITSCGTDDMDIPTPKKIPYEIINHNDIRIDNYYWLRDDTRSNEEILTYLLSENKYADKWFSSKHNYKTEIVNELIEQLPEEEVSFPLYNNGYLYYEKLNKGDQLPKFYKKESSNSKETLYLNPNIKLKTQEYYSVNTIRPSGDNSLIAYIEDNNGRREYDIKIIDAITLKIIDSELKRTSRDIIWSIDNKYVIYSKKDPITLINNSVYAHKIGSSSSDDVLLYKEDDTEYDINISLSKSKKYAYINIAATNQNEIRLIDLDNPLIKPELFLERLENHLYYLEHINDKSFYILSNHNAPNFKVLKTNTLGDLSIIAMNVVIDHDINIFISDIFYKKNNLILEIRENGLPEISIYNLSSKGTYRVNHEDNAYTVDINTNNVNSSDDGFYFNYSSLTTPDSIKFFNFSSMSYSTVWQKEILNFDDKQYSDERFFYEARDGVDVPAIIFYKNDTNLASAPILFYGYGSYGINTDASFRQSLIPLLDRGFIYVILNIRGGGEMGKHWYDDGRMFNKMNTFNDFNDGVHAVLDKAIGNPENVFARGGSAGGLLMGAIINLEPNLYKGILSGVPFVDVLTTMSDPSIPLTTFEYDEWGNPANIDEYNYIKQYSPYDNIFKANYPSVFITSSLYDSQVQYFEPAKYTPKLREYSQSDNPILMKMNLIGGHGGLSGKINQFNEIAEEFNFIINLVD
ncbi:prolyl oligopeptidase family serine peptidase [Gammaproteobacteria bacterium]|nr:prolyl oligopeptidase family serine peptidase [Gammaproteobacteria bacterium]